MVNHYKDGQIKSLTGTAVVNQHHDYEVNSDGTCRTRVYTGPNGANSPRWAQRTVDPLGRTIREERPGYGGSVVTNTYVYNNSGQLSWMTVTGIADTLYQYDSMGNQLRSAVDVNVSGSIEVNGLDRVTDKETYYEQDGDKWWRVTDTRVYPTVNDDTPKVTSRQRTQLTGSPLGQVTSLVESIDVHGNKTTVLTTIDGASKSVTEDNYAPDVNNETIRVTVNGLVVDVRTPTGAWTAYGYDALRRQTSVIDPRTGARTTHYDVKGRVDYVEDADGNRTSYGFDAATGLRVAVSNALNKTVYTAYDELGRVAKTWGHAAYPVTYGYDGYGQMTNMVTYRGGTGWNGTTWPSSPGAGDATVWQFEDATGLLTSKVYADGKGVSYTYTAGGRLAIRTWARQTGGQALVTTYSYANTAELAAIDYSDNTPDVGFGYNRLGRLSSVTDGVGTRTFAYNSDLQLSSETITGLYSRVISRSYTTSGLAGLPAGLSVAAGGGSPVLYDVADGYDAMGRLTSLIGHPVASVTNTVIYSYLTNSSLLAETLIETTGSSSTGRISRVYDSSRNLLTQVKNEVGAQLVSQHDYANDPLGRRTSISNSGSAFDSSGAAIEQYSYNDRSEVVSADRFFGSNTNDTSNPVGLRSYDYGYDNSGNRTEVSRSGATWTYTANSLNQYTQQAVPGVVFVTGAAGTGATVTVNNHSADRQGTYFHTRLTVANGAAEVYQPVTVVGVCKNAGTNQLDVVTVETGSVFLARSPEAFTYDDEGNISGDGRWSYNWDAENRLTAIEATAAAISAGAPGQKLAFTYDYQNRRVRKQVYTWQTNGWLLASDAIFVYDGWNLVQEVINTGTTLTTNSYLWGLDVSRTLQAGAGIGGLIATVRQSSGQTKHLLYLCDANGNVAQLVDVVGGSLNAQYEYGPFGDPVVARGPAAKDNPYRFSTKYTDSETDLVYFGARYYAGSTGRWISRDPITERGGYNLYRSVRNAPTNLLDPLGMFVPFWCFDDCDTVGQKECNVVTEFASPFSPEQEEIIELAGEVEVIPTDPGDLFVGWLTSGALGALADQFQQWAQQNWPVDFYLGSPIISVGNIDGLTVVIGHGNGEFASYEVEHVDKVALGTIAASLSLDA